MCSFEQYEKRELYFIWRRLKNGKGKSKAVDLIRLPAPSAKGIISRNVCISRAVLASKKSFQARILYFTFMQIFHIIWREWKGTWREMNL